MDIQEIISNLKQIATECEKVTSGNVSHKIANIEHAILNIADYLENYCQLGWYSADEDEPEPYETVVVYCETASGITSAKEACVNENHCWSEPDVQWWCYPPKEERWTPEDISQQLDNIEDNILDDLRDIRLAEILGKTSPNAPTPLPCYAPNGICSNPFGDCINCPKRGTGGTWSTSTNFSKNDE